MEILRWKKIEELFSHACALPEQARREYLEISCGEDAELCAEVMTLIESDNTTDHLLDAPFKKLNMDELLESETLRDFDINYLNEMFRKN